jgi:outer membrane protein OmpA-like peptidoglycan-associated protein
VGVTKYVTIAIRPLPVFRVRVTNAETGVAIPAHIQIMQRNATEPAYTMATDSASGSARTRLDEGLQYNLHIEQMGYEAVDMQIANVGDSMNIALKPIKKGEVFIMKNMFFATNKTRILPTSEEELNGLANYLERHPEIRIKIVGHTDSVGKDEANQKLSEGRAEAVMKDLIKRGIDPSRLEAEGRGETEPIDTNDTEEGRQNNRRVEIHIL